MVSIRGCCPSQGGRRSQDWLRLFTNAAVCSNVQQRAVQGFHLENPRPSKTFNFEGQVRTLTSLPSLRWSWKNKMAYRLSWHCHLPRDLHLETFWNGLEPQSKCNAVVVRVVIHKRGVSTLLPALSWIAATTSKWLASAATAAAVRPFARWENMGSTCKHVCNGTNLNIHAQKHSHKNTCTHIDRDANRNGAHMYLRNYSPAKQEIWNLCVHRAKCKNAWIQSMHGDRLIT